jgi:hypothetical protein
MSVLIADKDAGWGEFWASLLNLSGGNVDSIRGVFRYAGVSETNIVRAYKSLRGRDERENLQF